jgi:dTDP-4-amino-4,6-dideoxygalactose transaminase
MKTPLLNPARHNKKLMPQLQEAAIRVLESGQYILGKELQEFETEVADYLQCSHCSFIYIRSHCRSSISCWRNACIRRCIT